MNEDKTEASKGFQIQCEVVDGFLSYRIQGVTSIESMKGLASRIRSDADLNKASGALLDCAGMIGSLPIASLFKVGEVFARKLPDVKLAAINPPPSWKANHFSEDVVGGRGGELKHFASRDSALRWLRQP